MIPTLNPPNYLTIRNAINADPTMSAMIDGPDSQASIANLFNQPAVPNFWVWRTSVDLGEIVSVTTADGTIWSWTSYIARSQGERDAWREMFATTGKINFAQANIIQGLNDIFSGAGAAPAAQRTHLFTTGRRLATRGEKLFTTGTGSTAAPGLLVFEGALTPQDISQARAN